MCVVKVDGINMIAQSVQYIGGNTTMKYGGASTNDKSGQGARTKDAGDVYDVWDDDWSE